jgi:hypothetical protein
MLNVPAMKRAAARRRAGAVPWWLSGGIPAANCLAAYQPKGAANLAASYVNLANPGTYNAAPGVAPTWSAATGWTFDGSSQYLITGDIIGANTYTTVCLFSNAASGVFTMYGTAQGGIGNNRIMPNRSNSVFYGDTAKGPGMASGVVGIAGTSGYRNGVIDAAGAAVGNGSIAMVLGAQSQVSGGVPSITAYWPGKIQAYAVYDIVLTAPQMLAIATAMAAL